MSDEERALPPEPDAESNNDRSLTVDDLVLYLHRLAGLHKDSRTGNPRLSEALQLLAQALRRHAHVPVHRLGEALGVAAHKPGRRTARERTKVQLPLDVESLPLHAAEEVLAKKEFTKAQLIDLGAKRFGISRSRLTRLARNQVIDAVRAAMSHEKSLGVISDAARRGGEQRSS